MKLGVEESAKLRKEIIDKISNTLLVKAKEYVRNDDMMHNFNAAAEESGVIRERALEWYRLKHIVSRNDLINDLERDGKLPTRELALEKYIDIANYYILELESILHRIDQNGDNRQGVSQTVRSNSRSRI